MKVYICEENCGVVGTSDAHPCYKCGGEMIEDRVKDATGEVSNG